MLVKTERDTAPQILFSCYSQKSREGEQFVPEHRIGYTLSGSSDAFVGGKAFHFKEGDFRFVRRNQLSRFTKYPPPGGEYRSISIVIDQGTLRSMANEHYLHTSRPYTGDNTLVLKPNALLKNFVSSLLPYLDGAGNFNNTMAGLKVKELVMLLLDTNPALKDVLFDFSEPGKIDLEAYMNEHYRFNTDINRFAYLTGRSLATFKRDFEKIFHTSPGRWLIQKRLSDAWYLIKEKGWKASDVYLEVGFKDLSHFSFAFRKAYGVAPSKIVQQAI